MSVSMLSMLSMSMSTTMLSLIPCSLSLLSLIPPLSFRKNLLDISNGHKLSSHAVHKRKVNKRLKVQGKLRSIVEKSVGDAVQDYKHKLTVLQNLVDVLKIADGGDSY